MNHFFFVRHGQTDANLQGLMCGASWDIALNPTGEWQIRAAAETLAKSGVRFGEIAVSPMLRARQSAQIIVDRLGCAAARVVEDLHEWDIGSWDRQLFESVKEQFLGTGEPEGGESRSAFHTRIVGALATVATFSPPPIIVAHGAVWLAVQAILKIPPVRVENGIPFEVRSDSNREWIAARVV